MKKMLSICLLLGIIFLTGCEKNKLVCNYTDDSIENLTAETKYVFKFNEDTIKTATMTTEVTLSGDYNEDVYITSYAEMAASAVSEYNTIDGVTATSTNKKNVVTLKVEMTTAQMSEEDLETYGLNLTKSELKEELEDAGYTCK